MTARRMEEAIKTKDYIQLSYEFLWLFCIQKWRRHLIMRKNSGGIQDETED